MTKYLISNFTQVFCEKKKKINSQIINTFSKKCFVVFLLDSFWEVSLEEIIITIIISNNIINTKVLIPKIDGTEAIRTSSRPARGGSSSARTCAATATPPWTPSAAPRRTRPSGRRPSGPTGSPARSSRRASRIRNTNSKAGEREARRDGALGILSNIPSN